MKILRKLIGNLEEFKCCICFIVRNSTLTHSIMGFTIRLYLRNTEDDATYFKVTTTSRRRTQKPVDHKQPQARALFTTGLALLKSRELICHSCTRTYRCLLSIYTYISEGDTRRSLFNTQYYRNHYIQLS